MTSDRAGDKVSPPSGDTLFKAAGTIGSHDCLIEKLTMTRDELIAQFDCMAETIMTSPRDWIRRMSEEDVLLLADWLNQASVYMQITKREMASRTTSLPKG